MKTLLRSYFIYLFTLWLTSKAGLGLKVNDGWQTYLFAAAVLTGIIIFIKPLLKLLFLPINFLTLGFFAWIINVAILYLLTLFVSQIQVTPFEFVGFSYQGFIIPKISFGIFESFLVTSLAISIISNFLIWLYR